jgi:DOMON domain
MHHLIKNYMALIISFLVFLSSISMPDYPSSQIEVNGMRVVWKIAGKCIDFELSAPTSGWLAIGFNASEDLAGTYLIMACVELGKVKVVEYKTLAPGDYRPITDLGGKASVEILGGHEEGNATQVRFRIPQQVSDGFHKSLLPGSKWRLLVAYSREDDFKHHSMMRTNIAITL